MKRKWILLLLAALLILSPLSCRYDPPEGYSPRFHSHDEALAYAKSIDPEAVVSEEHTDLTDEYEHEHRQWDAVIHGVACHVASSERWVWNTGVLAGEFVKVHYCMDTDYDYYVLQQLLQQQGLGWTQMDESPFNRYNWNDLLIVRTHHDSGEPLTEAELEVAWAQACALHEQYLSHPVRKELWIGIQAPTLWHQGEETVLKMDDVAINDYSPEGKEAFSKKYYESWDYLDQGYRRVE